MEAVYTERPFADNGGTKEPPRRATGRGHGLDLLGGLTVSDSTTRRPLSKRIRFEVFKRDDFTCQYCGKQPPETVLHVDHIHPVSKGGSDGIDNLITSCADCNLGKSDKELGDKAVRPDAVLMSAQVAQELAELKTFRAITAAYEDELLDMGLDYSKMWSAYAGVMYEPDPAVFVSMVRKYGPDDFHTAFMATASMVKRRKVSPYEMMPYMWGVLKNVGSR